MPVTSLIAIPICRCGRTRFVCAFIFKHIPSGSNNNNNNSKTTRSMDFPTIILNNRCPFKTASKHIMLNTFKIGKIIHLFYNGLFVSFCTLLLPFVERNPCRLVDASCYCTYSLRCCSFYVVGYFF